MIPFVALGARIIHRKHGVSYRDMALDLAFLCSGGVLVHASFLAIYGITSLRDLPPAVQQAALGFWREVSFPWYAVTLLAGVLLIAGRVMYRIRRDRPQSEEHSIVPTAEITHRGMDNQRNAGNRNDGAT